MVEISPLCSTGIFIPGYPPSVLGPASALSMLQFANVCELIQTHTLNCPHHTPSQKSQTSLMCREIKSA